MKTFALKLATWCFYLFIPFQFLSFILYRFVENNQIGGGDTSLVIFITPIFLPLLMALIAFVLCLIKKDIGGKDKVPILKRSGWMIGIYSLISGLIWIFLLVVTFEINADSLFLIGLIGILPPIIGFVLLIREIKWIKKGITHDFSSLWVSFIFFCITSFVNSFLVALIFAMVGA